MNMNKKFLYISIIIFLITQICIAYALIDISNNGVGVYQNGMYWSVSKY